MEKIKNISLDEIRMVEDEFGFIRQNIHTMGNNDTEFSRLDEVLTAYKQGKFTAEEAISQARAIQEGKIDR